MKRISSLLLLLLTVVTLKAANSVTLAWNPNSETNLAGYRLYVGNASRNYPTNYVAPTNVVNIGGNPSCTLTVSNLDIGRKYYFAVTAFTSDGLESDYSDEVLFPGFKPGKPTTLRITSTTNQTAAIWINEPASSTTVQWSGDLQTWKGWAQVKTLDSSAPVGDAIFLSGFSPDTARFWRAVADATQVAPPPSSPLPAGLRLTPIYPPLPSANP